MFATGLRKVNARRSASVTGAVLYRHRGAFFTMSNRCAHKPVTIIQVWPLGYFTNISLTINHAHRLCLELEKLLYLELSRNPYGYFKLLLDPGGGFASATAAPRFPNETAVAQPFQKRYGYKFIAAMYVKRPFTNRQKRQFGCNVYVTVVAAGQSPQFYSGVRTFSWCLSSTPQIISHRRGLRFYFTPIGLYNMFLLPRPSILISLLPSLVLHLHVQCLTKL
jgi:hypothetical protein